MSWARYDDALPQNRKVAWLRAHGVNGIAALGVHLLLNTWSRHEGMQGFIPDYVPEQLAGRQWKKLISLLAEDGCAMLTPVDNGWMINDYEEYGDRDDGTPVDEKRARLSKVRAEAGRRGGNAKAAKAASKATDLPDGDEAGKRSPNGNNGTTDPRVTSRDGEQFAHGPNGTAPGKTGAPSSKRSDLPASKPKQSSSPVPVPSNSPTATGSPNAPAGFAPRIVRAYVNACRDHGVVAPEESQARVERSARSLLAQGYEPDAIETAARNAAVGGWTDLATQLQRDSSRASPTAARARTSTTDDRVEAALRAGREAQVEHDRLHLNGTPRRAIG